MLIRRKGTGASHFYDFSYGLELEEKEVKFTYRVGDHASNVLVLVHRRHDVFCVIKYCCPVQECFCIQLCVHF